MGLRLTPIKDLGGLSRLREEISEELLGGDTSRPFRFDADLDQPAHDPPAWTDITTGALGLADETAAALGQGDPAAVAAVAHQLIHAIGEGPAFGSLEDQLLEEAIVETLTQTYLSDFVKAFGGQAAALPELFRPTADAVDLEVSRPTAANISVERFGRLAAWLEGLDGTDDPEDYEEATLKWAVRLKATEGEDRFKVMAVEAAMLNGEADDIGAIDYLEEYLRGYMHQLERSRSAFAGLDYANARAWKDADATTPSLADHGSADPWREELARVERVILDPLPPQGAIGKTIASLHDPALAALARRNTEARALLWAARSLDASK